MSMLCRDCKYSDLECNEQCKDESYCSGCFGASFNDCFECEHYGEEINMNDTMDKELSELAKKVAEHVDKEISDAIYSRMAMKPRIEKVGGPFFGDEHTEYYCSNCGGYICSVSAIDKSLRGDFCKWCGQKIDWRDNNG